jgi:hypothetical protein
MPAHTVSTDHGRVFSSQMSTRRLLEGDHELDSWEVVHLDDRSGPPANHEAECMIVLPPVKLYAARIRAQWQAVSVTWIRVSTSSHQVAAGAICLFPQ